MSSQPSVKPMMKRRYRRTWLILALVLLLLPLGFLGYQSYRQYRAEQRIRAACAVADAEDPGWRLADLLDEYEKLPAATAFLEMMKARPTRDNGGIYLGWHGDDITFRPGALPYDSDSKPNVRLPETYLKLLRTRLQDARLSQLRQRAAVFYAAPLGYLHEARSGRFDLIQEARYLTNYFRDEVLLAVHEDRFEDAIRFVCYQFRISEEIRRCPTPLHHLVGSTLRSLALEDVQQLMMFGNASPSQLLGLQKETTRHDSFDPLRTMKLIRADLHDRLEKARQDSKAKQQFIDQLLGPSLPSKPSTWDKIKYEVDRLLFRWEAGSLDEAEAEILELANDMIAAARHYPDKLIDMTPWKARKVSIVTKQQLVGTLEKLPIADAHVCARLRAAQLAIACERYRLVTGDWPKSLSDLVPSYITAIPLDPYTGDHLLYRILPDGAAVYSVGKDLRDDGGKVLRMGIPPPDPGIRLYNPALRGLKYEVGYPL